MNHIIVAISIIALLVSIRSYLFFKKKNPLQERATAFLQMPIPDGMDYAEDSLAERFIYTYSVEGKIELDPELHEILQIIIMESEFTENAAPGTEEHYMNESAEILQAILNEANR